MGTITNTEADYSFQLAVQTDDDVAATTGFKILPDARISEPSWEGENVVFMPSGKRYPTISLYGQEWIAFDVEFASIGFGSVVYPLSSAANYAAPSGGGPYTWTNIPNVGAVNSSKAFTVQAGNAVNAEQFIAARCIGYTVHTERVEPKLTTHWIAKRASLLSSGLTAGGTAIEDVPVSGQMLAYYYASSFANLAVPASRTRLLHCYSHDLDVNDLWVPEWPVNDYLQSYGDVSEQAGEYAVTLMLLEQLASGEFTGGPFTLAAMGRDTGYASPIYFRTQAMGPVIGTGTVTIAEIVDPGSGYTAATVAVSDGGGGTGAAVTATVGSGRLTGLTISAPGSGYTKHPIATVNGDGVGAKVKLYVTPCYQFIMDQMLLITGRPATSFEDGKKVRSWDLRVATDLTNALKFVTVNQVAAL